MSSAPETAQETPPPARGASHYAKGTAANMVRSMVVILAILLGWYFVAGQSNEQPPEKINVAEAAEHRAQQAGQPFAHPEGLPEGWVATSVRYDASTGDAMTWNAGYTTPDDEHVSVRQAVDPGAEWLDVQTNDGADAGTLTTQDGRTWTKRDREGQTQRSLVQEPTSKVELTTVVTGTASWKQLEGFADRLVEADPKG